MLIGDSIADVNLAKNAGIHFIGVKTGTNPDDFLIASDILLENLSDIIVESKWVYKLNFYLSQNESINHNCPFADNNRLPFFYENI